MLYKRIIIFPRYQKNQLVFEVKKHHNLNSKSPPGDKPKHLMIQNDSMRMPNMYSRHEMYHAHSQNAKKKKKKTQLPRKRARNSRFMEMTLPAGSLHHSALLTALFVLVLLFETQLLAGRRE